MSGRPIKVPGLDHPITIARNPNRVIVRFNGKVMADSRGALTLREAAYAPVQYIPLADADMTLLQLTEHSTYCPYKGDASYFSVRDGGERMANAIWSYEAPYDQVGAIKGFLAFYADRFEISEEAAS